MENSADLVGVFFSCVFGVQVNFTDIVGVADKRRLGRLSDLEWADQLQASLHKLAGRQLAFQPGKDVLNAGFSGVAELVDGEIDPLVQRAAVDPFVSGVPAFDGRRVHERLTHDRSRAAESRYGLGGVWELVGAYQFDGSSPQFCGVLYLLMSGVLEKFGCEQRTQNRNDLPVVILERLDQNLDGFGVVGRLDAP